MKKALIITGALLLVVAVKGFAQTVKVAPEDRFKLQETKGTVVAGATKTNTGAVASGSTAQTKTGAPSNGQPKNAQPVSAESRYTMEPARPKK